MSRIGVAPCGHRGECVVGNYYRCLEGCDAPKASARQAEAKKDQPSWGESILKRLGPFVRSLEREQAYQNALASVGRRLLDESDDQLRKRLRQAAKPMNFSSPPPYASPVPISPHSGYVIMMRCAEDIAAGVPVAAVDAETVRKTMRPADYPIGIALCQGRAGDLIQVRVG